MREIFVLFYRGERMPRKIDENKIKNCIHQLPLRYNFVRLLTDDEVIALFSPLFIIDRMLRFPISSGEIIPLFQPT